MTAPRHRKRKPGSTAAGAARPCQASEACTSGASACCLAAPKTASKKVAPAAEQVAEPKPPAKPKPAAAPPKAGQQAGRQGQAGAGEARFHRSSRPRGAQALPSAKLDLRLPKELVQKMAPPGTEETHKPKPLLPPMFEEKDDSDFRLNGQLLYPRPRTGRVAAPGRGRVAVRVPPVGRPGAQKR
ncbi:hypothetical protein P4238_29015 [Pseudomonas aeruginosa]|nr:hypothetical protein [Pseudomonas aeruginosa]